MKASHTGAEKISDLIITPAHFSVGHDLAAARKLLRESVDQVEIEVFSYCNRTCWFCPNSHIDRRSANNYMDEAIYLQILDDLGSIDYRGVITYSRYNEPLADKIILTRLRQARERVPNAVLSTHTNGDYLDRDYLQALREAGLNRLHIQTYLANKEKFSDRRILNVMERQIRKLGLAHKFTRRAPGIRYTAELACPGMEVTLDARNFDQVGVDRGQTIVLQRAYQRTSPCLMVFKHVYIDHDGAVVPCCNIRSDEPAHQQYVIDRITPGKSLFDVYANSPLAQWRRSLLTYGKKQRPCDTCAYEPLPEEPELIKMMDEIARVCNLTEVR